MSRDDTGSICRDLAVRAKAAGDPRLVVTFPVSVPANHAEAEVTALLERQGYTRIHARDGDLLHVVQDRFRLGNADQGRVAEAIEAALRVGQGRVSVRALGEADETEWKFSASLHCAECDIHYPTPPRACFPSTHRSAHVRAVAASDG